METFIIQGMRQLLNPYYCNSMDELPQDLNSALEETAKALEETAKALTSRLEVSTKTLTGRRISDSKVRKSRTWKCCSKPKSSVVGALCSSVPKSSAVSDDSESSLDNQLQRRMDVSTNGSHQQSDSDEIASKDSRHNYHLTWRHCAANLGESDSLNENFYPSREPRRKRKFKRMAVDPPSSVDHDFQSLSSVPLFSQKSKRLRNIKQQKLAKLSVKSQKLSQLAVSQLSAEMENIYKTFTAAAASCGKRKRCSHEKSIECNGYDCKGSLSGKISTDETYDCSNSCHCMDYDNGRTREACSSGVSSSDSECGALTNDESREADDEQSDFFHEPGPTYGVPSFPLWWQDEHFINDSNNSDPKLEAIISKSLHDMSESSKKMFKDQVDCYKAGRQIRSGRRRLEKSISTDAKNEDKEPFLIPQYSYPVMGENCVGKISPNDKKKRRRMPPLGNALHVFEDAATPLPESNIGFRMLQDMGWKPGTGLGPAGGGILSPVKPSSVQNKQGIGYCKRRNDVIFPQATLFGWRSTTQAPPPPPPSPQPNFGKHGSPS